MRRSAVTIFWLSSSAFVVGSVSAAPAAAPTTTPSAAPASAAAQSAPARPLLPTPKRAQQPPAPPTSGGAAPAASSAAAPGNAPDRSNVVVVEQAGKPVGLGTLLNGDGRIVTALSRLKENTPLVVRYASGNVEPARLGSADTLRDLALLVPKTVRVRSGAKASRSALPNSSEALYSFTLQPNRTVSVAQQALKSSNTSAPAGLTELASPPKASDAGGPLLDAAGETVAVLVGGCAGAGKVPNCQAPPLALPVAEVRAFLRELPAEAAVNVPWLGADGIRAETAVVRGVRVTRLDAGSPAANAGLRAHARGAPGDVLVAVAGEPTPNPDALRSALSQHAPGQRVELLLFNSTYRTVAVRLAERPAGPAATHSAANSAAKPGAGTAGAPPAPPKGPPSGTAPTSGRPGATTGRGTATRPGTGTGAPTRPGAKSE